METNLLIPPGANFVAELVQRKEKRAEKKQEPFLDKEDKETNQECRQ